MAKKARTPNPPRPVQAPKRRKRERHGLDPERRRNLLLYGGAAAGAVALVVVLVFVLGGRGGGSGGKGDPAAIAATMRAAGCQYKDVAATSTGLHMQQEDQVITYNTYPPTSGEHHPAAVIWGAYSQPVDPRQVVHNMEHGGIVLWYGPEIPDAERRALTDFYNENPNGIVVTPLDPSPKLVKFPQHTNLTTQIALTAWTASVEGGRIEESRGVVAICPRFDRSAFTAFRDQFRGKGPERFSVDSLRPGT